MDAEGEKARGRASLEELRGKDWDWAMEKEKDWDRGSDWEKGHWDPPLGHHQVRLPDLLLGFRQDPLHILDSYYRRRSHTIHQKCTNHRCRDYCRHKQHRFERPYTHRRHKYSVRNRQMLHSQNPRYIGLKMKKQTMQGHILRMYTILL